MLPDIRAVVSAVVAAVGLLMIAFGAVATFRVAQESHGVLQADFARRGQSEPPRAGQHPVMVIDTPGPHLAPPPPLPVVEVKDAPIRAVVPDTLLVAETPVAPVPVAAAPAEAALPVVEQPVGGPLAEPEPPQSNPQSKKERAAEQARHRAAAKKAREARIARERKAKARARAKQAQTFNNGFGNSSFGNGFGKQ